jgi:hypothetical protein
VKEEAKHIIDHLPKESSMEDIIHALYVQVKFDRGLRQIDEGKGIPHEEAKKRMRECVK